GNHNIISDKLFEYQCSKTTASLCFGPAKKQHEIIFDSVMDRDHVAQCIESIRRNSPMEVVRPGAETQGPTETHVGTQVEAGARGEEGIGKGVGPGPGPGPRPGIDVEAGVDGEIDTRRPSYTNTHTQTHSTFMDASVTRGNNHRRSTEMGTNTNPLTLSVDGHYRTTFANNNGSLGLGIPLGTGRDSMMLRQMDGDGEFDSTADLYEEEITASDYNQLKRGSASSNHGWEQTPSFGTNVQLTNSLSQSRSQNNTASATRNSSSRSGGLRVAVPNANTANGLSLQSSHTSYVTSTNMGSLSGSPVAADHSNTNHAVFCFVLFFSKKKKGPLLKPNSIFESSFAAKLAEQSNTPTPLKRVAVATTASSVAHRNQSAPGGTPTPTTNSMLVDRTKLFREKLEETQEDLEMDNYAVASPILDYANNDHDHDHDNELEISVSDHYI
ncbi:hypothetical protein RFI_23863, partial [Reticulomyxa filosa]